VVPSGPGTRVTAIGEGAYLPPALQRATPTHLGERARETAARLATPLAASQATAGG